ncbi:unnamed protein product [Didymodactylos carnosus]|uniref:DarT domain-containing protein n=1 Tax=Didymodactylos carnosus TaxID=1234261 RepID=A0A815MMN6_9BILA|nr:unnamed protein product [Didymodactylos carnosus]CAF4305388.1 unnamed protein product [Didymodactylos carnosus]
MRPDCLEILLLFEIGNDRIFQQLSSSTAYGRYRDYNKIQEQIKRDNIKLFSKIPSFDYPEELFIKCLNMQKSPWKDYIYHYTHIENAVSIFNEKVLKCRNNVVYFKDSAALNMIPSDEVKSYVPFYFRPHTPNQHINENLGSIEYTTDQFGQDPICPIPIFIKIPLKSIFKCEDIEWKVSVGNMARKRYEYGNTTGIIQQFDFNGVYMDKMSPRQFISSQQEFLIKSKLSLESIDGLEIICQDLSAANCLKCLLDDCNPFKNKIKVNKTLYHEKNSKCIVEQHPNILSIYLQNEKKDGTVILQYNTIDNSEDEISFIKDKFTISASESLTLSVDLKRINYAVFYAHRGQLWLLNSNHQQSEFALPLIKQKLESFLIENINLHDIVTTLKIHPILKYCYEQKINTHSTLEQYTLKIMESFSPKLIAQHESTLKSFYIVLAFHVIGLGQANVENDIEQHYRYSQKIVNEISDLLPSSLPIFELINKIIKSG